MVEENNAQGTQLSKTAYAALISEEMGIGPQKVCYTITEYLSSGVVVSPNWQKCRSATYEKLDEFDKSAIRRKVHSFFYRNQLSTLDNVLKAVNDDEDMRNFARTTLYRLVTRCKRVQ